MSRRTGEGLENGDGAIGRQRGSWPGWFKRALGQERAKGRWRRWMAALILILAVVLCVSWLHYYDVLLYVQKRAAGLKTFPPVAPGDRILIFAPHPDDETLGPGGLIALARRQDIDVTVVLLTNGDSFRYSAEETFRKINLSPQEYVAYGQIRQKETLAALKLLGLPESKILFLGYPDQGLVPMWFTHWETVNPYTARYTQTSRSPYANSFHQAAIYAGSSLLEDMTKVLRQVQPTILLIPHPNDAHPDHWAGYLFAERALESLKLQGLPFAQETRVYTYLIHRGKWPLPKGLRPFLPLVPPATLVGRGDNWMASSLPREVAELKIQAIQNYRTQVTMMRNYLLSFARNCEIFGFYPPVTIPTVMGRPGPVAWDQVIPLILDPKSDTLIREVEGAGDFLGIKAALVQGRVYFQVSVREKVSPRVTYRLWLFLLERDSRSQRRFLITLSPPNSVMVQDEKGHKVGEGALLQTKGRELELSLPWQLFQGEKGFLLGGESYLGTVFLDRTGWRVTYLPGDLP